MSSSGIGPHIRVWRHRARETNEAGMTLSQCSATPTALIALWDGEWGFSIYDYKNVTLFQREEMEEVRMLNLEARCHSRESLFLGEWQLNAGWSILHFEEVERPRAEAQLRSLLNRTFGYSPIDHEAERILNHNPLVSLGRLTLGRLHDVVGKGVTPGQSKRIQ